MWAVVAMIGAIRCGGVRRDCHPTIHAVAGLVNGFYDEFQSNVLNAVARCPRRRRLRLERQVEETEAGDRGVRVELPLRLLVIVSRPPDLGSIDPRATTPAMLDALEGPTESPSGGFTLVARGFIPGRPRGGFRIRGRRRRPVVRAPAAIRCRRNRNKKPVRGLPNRCSGRCAPGSGS